MTATKLTNLINPQVMAQMVSAKLPKKIRFTPFAAIDNTLVGRAGNTITVPILTVRFLASRAENRKR